ncbi:MAG: hypothetical protein ABI877_10570 [Gemmatimonadaceae bacterium]
MGLENVKLLYATAPGGVHVTIPLIREGAYDVADITQRLKNAGVTDDQLPFVVFTSVPPAAPSGPRMAAMNRSAVQVPAMSRAAEDSAEPVIPIPTAPNTVPPQYSELGPLSSVAVTPTWRQTTGCRYSMKRADNNGYVVVQDLPQSSFPTPDDFNKIKDGRIKLCHAFVWRRADQQFLRERDAWDQRVETKHGMNSTTSVSVTASIGYSGYGVSASLSATYGYSITVDDESTVTNEIHVEGAPGQSQTAVLWELCRVYLVEVDGVLRRESNPFQIIYNDKGGNHQLIDTWGPTYEVVSKEATLMTTIFKDA